MDLQPPAASTQGAVPLLPCDPSVAVLLRPPSGKRGHKAIELDLLQLQISEIVETHAQSAMPEPDQMLMRVRVTAQVQEVLLSSLPTAQRCSLVPAKCPSCASSAHLPKVHGNGKSRSPLPALVQRWMSSPRSFRRCFPTDIISPTNLST
jgi:hypothetical protein